MKYIYLKNDFKVDRANKPNIPSNEELSLNWLATGMGYGYKNGLTSDKRRIMVGIIKKIEAAKEAKAEYLEVNPVEYQFMKTGFDGAITSSNEVLYVTIAEEALLSATDDVLHGTATMPTQLTNGNSAAAGETNAS